LPEQKETKQKGPKEKDKDKKAGAEAQAKPKAPVVKKDENFRYIVRMVNTDLDGNHSVVIALSHIKGVGMRTAEIIARMSNVPRTTKIGDLKDEKTSEIEKLVLDYSEKAPHWMVNRQSDWSTGADLHIVGVDVEINKRDDVNLMKMIRCYRGIRHEQGQKVRGQRTRSNGRTGMTMGVMKKREQPGEAAAPETKE
jgi:small subunit ribosomal protein S13